MTGASGATGALADLACAWTSLKLADRNMMAAPEKALREAITALEDLGDYACPTPARVLVAARSLARQWVLSDSVTREGPLFGAVDAVIHAAMAYLGGDQGRPIGQVIQLKGHHRAAGGAA